MRFTPLRVKFMEYLEMTKPLCSMKDPDGEEPELWIVWDIKHGCRCSGFVKHKYEAEQLAKQLNEKEKHNEKIHG